MASDIQLTAAWAITRARSIPNEVASVMTGGFKHVLSTLEVLATEFKRNNVHEKKLEDSVTWDCCMRAYSMVNRWLMALLDNIKDDTVKSACEAAYRVACMDGLGALAVAAREYVEPSGL